VDEKVKRARIEALFRDVNERIAESAQRFDAESTQFVCECADSDCTHRVPQPDFSQAAVVAKRLQPG
jgi:hypothetical protein